MDLGIVSKSMASLFLVMGCEELGDALASSGRGSLDENSALVSQTRRGPTSFNSGECDIALEVES